MNLNSLKIAIIGFTMISLFSCGSKDFTCTMKGTVIDRKSDTLMLKRVNEDFRFVKIFITIIDGKFEYKMEVKDIEAWDLTFKSEYDDGGWRSFKFFPDQRTVKIELHPTDQFEKNKVSGGKTNQAWQKYTMEQNNLFGSRRQAIMKIQDSIVKTGQVESAEMKQLNELYHSPKTDSTERQAILAKGDSLRNNGKAYVPAFMECQSQLEKLSHEIKLWKIDKIRKNMDLNTYSLLLMDLLDLFQPIDIITIKNIYPAYAKKYPNHPYTAVMASALIGKEKIRVTGHFVDFTLPDLTGKKQTLSELIKGKVALIDLWATWCGPCILQSRTMVPVYNEYHDKGFTIVGVAAEFKNTNAMKKRIDSEKWTWINLVDLDQQNHIWDIYGISGSGGMTFLVDKNGVILAINPTPEKVREKLKELL